MSYTEEELAGLTDEERAALEEAGDDDTTTTMEQSLEGADDGLEKDQNAGEGGEAAQEGADKGDGQADNAGGAAGAGDDGGAAAGDANSAVGQADAGKPAPLLIAEAPADADAKLAAIGEKKGTLLEQFDNGDITAKEYQSALDTLNKEERTIESAVQKAQIAAEMRQQQEVNNWMGQVQTFTTQAHPEYSTSKVRWMALDAFVKEIGSDPVNASLTGAQILAEAHKRVVEDLGEVQSKGKATADGKQQPLKGSKAEPPKTLAKVPAADNAMDDNKWAAFDRLAATDPVALEEKLMKLSESERDEYLSR